MSAKFAARLECERDHRSLAENGLAAAVTE